MSLAEKFQITVPYSKSKDDDGNEWTDAKGARTNVGNTPPGEEEKFNEMPVGYDATCYRDKFVKGFGGDTDVTGDVEPASLEKGFKRRELKATDDQYGGEHIDLFYGEAVSEDGEVGFVERNNYLDRI